MRFFFLLLTLLSAYGHALSQPSQAIDTLVIKNINIVDVETGAIYGGKDLWIAGERIVKISPHDTSNKVGYTIVNGTGQYIIPGLWDMHAHMMGFEHMPGLYTAHGVTGIRNMHGGKMIKDVLAERRDGHYKGFEFIYSGPVVDGPGENWSGTVVVSTPEEGRAEVRRQKRLGYDLIKVYSLLDPDTYYAIADECRRLEIPFAGHVPMAMTAEQAIQAGQKSVEHHIGLELALSDPDFLEKPMDDFKNLKHYFHEFLQLYDPSLFKDVLRGTISQDTWFCPTLVNTRSVTFEDVQSLKTDARLKYIPPSEKAYWFDTTQDSIAPGYLHTNDEYPGVYKAYFELIMSSLKPMLDNGSRFLAGTDSSNPFIYPGFSVHEELQLFVKAGFSELEALQTATLNPAIYAGRLHELGTVEVGKLANLVILENNPLEDISNTLSIAGVIRRGEYLDAKDLEELKVVYDE